MLVEEERTNNNNKPTHNNSWFDFLPSCARKETASKVERKLRKKGKKKKEETIESSRVKEINKSSSINIICNNQKKNRTGGECGATPRDCPPRNKDGCSSIIWWCVAQIGDKLYRAYRPKGRIPTRCTFPWIILLCCH